MTDKERSFHSMMYAAGEGDEPSFWCPLGGENESFYTYYREVRVGGEPAILLLVHWGRETPPVLRLIPRCTVAEFLSPNEPHRTPWLDSHQVLLKLLKEIAGAWKEYEPLLEKLVSEKDRSALGEGP